MLKSVPFGTDTTSISDTDGDGTAITVSGTNIFANGVDIGDLSASGGTVTGATKLTITFDSDATNANVQEVLQSIRFVSSSENPGTSRTVTFTATDKNAGSNSDTRTISITRVNDEPTLTATGSNPTFTEGGAAASLYSGASASTIEGGQNIQAMTMTVTNLADGSNERLNVDGTTIILTHGTNGTTATNSLNYSVSVVGSTATVSLTGGTMSTSATQTMVNAMSYQNNSNTPDTSNRVVTITSMQDGGGTANGGDNTVALSIASTVTVVQVNDEPTLTATGSNPTFTEGGASAGLFSGTSVSTVESGQTIAAMTLTVTNLANGINERLILDGSTIILTHGTSGTTATNSLSYAVTVVGSTATVSLTGGTMSTAATQTMVNAMSYQNTSNDPSTSNRVVTITSLRDSGGTANGGDDTAALAVASTVTVVGVNDEPTLTATGSNPTFTEGGATASLYSGASAGTIEAGQTIQALTMTVTNLADGSNERLNVDGSTIILTHGTNGTTATNSLNYSVSVVGSTATVSLTGGTMSTSATQTMVNAMSYQNNSNTPNTSNRVATITAMQDSGGTANGGDNTVALAIASTVTVVQVNDEPTLTATGSNPTFTEGGAAAGVYSGASASTIEAGQTITAMTLTVTNVNNGTDEVLNADGTAIVLTNGTSGTTATNSLSYSVSVAGTTATVSLSGGTMSTAATQTLINGMSYQNNSNAPDTSNRVITITALQDSGGTANGGDDTAALSIASTVTVSAVNSAPTDISLTSSSINQSAGVNGVVGTLSTTDVDDSSFTYSLVTGTGDTDNASFNINGNQLRANNAGTLAAGNYSVRLQTDDGDDTYQEAFSITVVDDIAPAVSSVTLPANATYTAGQNLDFVVNYDETTAVNTAGGTPRLILTIGSTTRYAAYAGSAGGTALLFRYTVQTGDNDGDGIALSTTLDPNGGTLRDTAGNDAGTNLGALGSLASVLVDALAPTVSEVTAVTTPTNDATPNVTFNTSEGGTLAIGGSCGSPNEGAVGTGNQSITLTAPDNSSALTANTYSDCTVIVTDAAGNSSATLTLTAFTVDLTAPTVSEVTAVATPTNDASPDVTINVGEAGTLAVGGSCGSSNEGAISTGNQTITLTATDNSSSLGDATYNDCTVTITDAAGNTSSALTLSSFTVDTTAPTVTEVTAVTTPTSDTTPTMTINTTEAGTLNVGGSCGSSSEGAISSGNQAITLTGVDNSSALNSGDFSDCTATVTDAAGNSSSVLTLTAFTVDTDAPNVVTNNALTVNEGGSGTINNTLLSATDAVSTAANVTYTLIGIPANGLLNLNATALSSGNTFSQDDIDNNRLTYAHDDSQTTGDAFSFTVRDALNNVNDNGGGNFQFNFTITAQNDGPVITEGTSTAVTISEDNSPTAFSLTLNATDADNTGSELTWSISSQATNGTASANGTGLSKAIGYTPNADYYGSDSFVVQISDGASNDSITVNVTIQPVNDAPTISGTPATSVVATFVYSFTPTASDVDTGDTLTFSIANQPGWAGFSTATGALTGTPGDTDVNSYNNIIISVTDGTDTTDLPAFNIDVQPNVDTDGDGISDAQELIDGTDPNDPDDYFDDTSPVVSAPADIVVDASGLYTSVSLRQLLSLAASATDSEVQIALDTLAVDNADGNNCCNPTALSLSNGAVQLPPGNNTITWQATDRKGNTGTDTQTVKVRPLVSVMPDQIGVEGGQVSFRVLLNGLSTYYPFDVPYVIDMSSTADSTDHDLIDGNITFAAGQTAAGVTINLTDDGTAEGNELLVIRLDDRTTDAEDLTGGYSEITPDIYDINSGAKTQHTITITEMNVAPDVALTLQQNAVNTALVVTGDGNVTVTASVTDLNTADTHTYDWSNTDSQLIDSDGDLTDATFVFDPTGLTEGVYTMRVYVEDNNAANDSAELAFRVLATAPVLGVTDTDGDGTDDATEGAGDTDNDGIPDYLDNIAASNVLPEATDATAAYLIECDPGLRCRLGRFALLSVSGGARLQQADFDAQSDLAEDPDYTHSGGIFDFEIHDLLTAGQTTRVVIPLLEAIPADAVYRKYSGGIWFTFIEDANNALHSSPGMAGYCPPPGDTSWEAGLIEGYYCVQLTLEDGGPNDADGNANRSIADPGGVATANLEVIPEEEIVVVRAKVKSGGGATGIGSLLFACLILLVRTSRAGRRKIVMIPCGLLCSLMSSQSQALDWSHADPNRYVELGIYQANGSRGSGEIAGGLAQDGITATVLSLDDSRTAWQLTGGYRYHRYFAVELGYLELGDITLDLSANIADTSGLGASLSRNLPITASGWLISHRFHYSIHEQLSGSVEVGLYLWDGDIDVSVANVEADLNDGSDPLFGTALKYNFTDNLAMQLHLKRIFFDNQEVDLTGASVTWSF